MRARINKWSHLANAGAKCGTGRNREKRNFLRYFTIMSLHECLNDTKRLENTSATSILRVEEGLESRPSKYVVDFTWVMTPQEEVCWGGGGVVYLTKGFAERPCPSSDPLPFYKPFLTERVPLSYTLY